MPLTQILAFLYVLVPLRGRRRAPPAHDVLLRALTALRPWAMAEVFMLGALVALVKLPPLADVFPQIALVSYGLLMLTLAALISATPTEQLWQWVERSRRVSSVVTGLSLGLLVCTSCRATVRAIGADRSLCPRCRAPLHERKPHSLAATAALVLSAALLYIPANVLPVMQTQTLFSEEDDTIMSGVIVVGALRLLAARVVGIFRQHRRTAAEARRHGGNAVCGGA